MKVTWTYWGSAVLIFTLCACSDSDGVNEEDDQDLTSADADSDANDAGRDASDAGSDANDAGTDDEETGSTKVEGEGDNGDPATLVSYAACKEALEPKCSYDESETLCASLTTPVIPLTDGGEWGGTKLEQGPYGSYVEWNAGEEFANPKNSLEGTCTFAISLFQEPPSVSDDIADLRGQDLTQYTIFRPACMKKDETYPVITWANGTCGQAGGYASLLATVASHGFVVVAANSRWTDQGNDEMLRALDLAEDMNADPESVFYEKLDLDHIGAMGHSQGSSATSHAASDPRIDALILWNGGNVSKDKPFLAVSGDADVTGFTPESMASSVDAASQPGAWLYYHQILETGGTSTGHLTLMEQPERVTEAAIAWWKYMLQGDAEAKKMFVGDDCGLCGQEDAFEYGQSDLP